MFCELKKDKKTFIFFKEYFKKLNNCKTFEAIFNKDNELQIEEIKKHLINNNLKNSNIESLKWINNYSKDYRTYLNTLKLLKFIFDCICLEKNITIEEISFKEYQEICDIYNKEKDLFIEYIFN